MSNYQFIKSEFEKKFNLLSIIGPTASGKTAFAANLAYFLDAEIISADSRQVYKDMNIGTGKDYDDYIVEGKKIPYHLIDIVYAGQKYNLFNYVQDFFTVYQNIVKRDKLPILCGGTGLYAEAIISNFDIRPVPQNQNLRKELENKSLQELAQILSSLKKLHNTSDIDTKKRAIRAIEIELFYKNNPSQKTNYPHINSLNIGLKFDRELQKQKITARLQQRLNNGMIDEVKSLLDRGISSETLIYYGLEYKFVTLYLLNQISFEQMFQQLNIAIHQFAKRQMTFFRHIEKQGVEIFWIDAQLPTTPKVQKAIDFIQNKVFSK
mgnify:CR=1 FL=1